MRTREEILKSEVVRYNHINTGYDVSNNIKLDLILELLLDIRDIAEHLKEKYGYWYEQGLLERLQPYSLLRHAERARETPAMLYLH